MVSPQGRRALALARRQVVAAIAGHLVEVSERDKTRLIASLDVLGSAFQSMSSERTKPATRVSTFDQAD